MKPANAHLKPALLLLLGWVCLQSSGIGFEPDPKEFKQAMDAIKSAACEEFKNQGLNLDWSKLTNEDCEIVDSFLKGRDTFRRWGHSCPMYPQLARVAELLGDAYPEREKEWRRKVEERKSGPMRTLTKAELETRLNALRDSKTAPVKIDSGLCRSSSGREAIEVECPHCGKHIVYSELDEVYHEMPPGYFLKIADKLRRWGIAMEVDARAVCPDCCQFPCDFKLSEFPAMVKIRNDADFSNDRWCPPCLRNRHWDMRVVQVCGRGFSNSGYDVIPVLPEAWVQETAEEFKFCLFPGGEWIYSRRKFTDLDYFEPRAEVEIPGKGKFVKVQNVTYTMSRPYLDEHLVEVVRRVRSSRMRDLPPVMLKINGHRVPASEPLAEALLAFAQNYKTFFYGQFGDQQPLKPLEPFLRKLFLDDSRWDIPPRLKSEALAGGRTRWSVDQDWYFKDILPKLKQELDAIDPNPRKAPVELEPMDKGGKVKWNLFGATPGQWDAETMFGVCMFSKNGPCRHFVALVTSVEGDAAQCLVYDVTKGKPSEFWKKWRGQLDHADKNFSLVAEFWSKDPADADALIITPWLRRGSVRSFEEVAHQEKR